MIRNSAGQRKAALYLATLPEAARSQVLKDLPADISATLHKMVADLVAAGWNDAELIESILCDELRGLTAQSSIPLDGLLGLAKVMPPDWTARIFSANVGVDAKFLLTMLDDAQHKIIADEIQRFSKIPDRLREAIVAEAMDCIQLSAQQ